MQNENSLLAYFFGGKTTPDQLWRFRRLSWLLSALFLLFSLLSIGEFEFAIRSVGKEAAPAVMQAYLMKEEILAMDAAAASELAARPGENYTSFKEFEKRRTLLNNELSEAVRMMDSVSERRLLQQLGQAVDDYKEAVSTARSAHERNDAAYLAYYRLATDILVKRVNVYCEQLEQYNLDLLNRSYHRQTIAGTILCVLFAVAGVLLIVLNLRSSAYLRQRFHRRYSVPLMISTWLLIGFTGYTMTSFVYGGMQLSTAKVDTFASITKLLDARAAVYSVNASLNRQLLDKALRTEHRKNLTASLTELVGDLNDGQWQELEKNLSADKRPAADAKGSLVQAAATFDFEDEFVVLQRVFQELRQFRQTIDQVHTLLDAGKAEEALKLSIGLNVGQGRYLFDKLDASLSQAEEVTSAHFTKVVARSHGLLAWTLYAAPLVVLGALWLFGAAISARIKEYEV